MQKRLANGVNLMIKDENGHKILLFDQNVRALDLEPLEATQIGASLYRSRNTVVYPVVVHLLETGFFNVPRTFKEVADAVHKENPAIRANSVIMVLRILHGKALLSRTGKRRNYQYKKAK
jgi:hypothetical protein